MIISEILNKSPDYKIVKDVRDYYTAESIIDGRKIVVSIELDDDSSLWEVVFYEETDESEDIRVSRKFNLTKNGSEFKVFALVKEIVTNFIKSRKPKMIGFSANKGEGREKLYQKLINKFNVSGYTVDKTNFEKSQSIFFTLTQK